MTTGEHTAVRIVPHFMRLHEWIAVEEGYFTDHGVEPVLMADWMHSVSSHTGDQYLDRPQDRVFAAEPAVVNSACAWGSVCNAGAGIGKYVRDLYGVGRFAIMAAPGSRIERLHELRDVPVGVGTMAGSHFTTLATLEQVLPKNHIRIIDAGGPGRRLAALLGGELEVATLLDPEIPIARSRGLRTLAQGEFRTLFWVAAGIEPAVLGGYVAALRDAENALRAGPDRYLHLWERNVPPVLAGDHDYQTFGTGETLVFERFDDDMIAETVRFAERWALRGHVIEPELANTVVSLTT